MFSTLLKTKIIILSTLILSSANAVNLDLSKLLSFRNGLNFCESAGGVIKLHLVAISSVHCDTFFFFKDVKVVS